MKFPQHWRALSAAVAGFALAGVLAPGAQAFASPTGSPTTSPDGSTARPAAGHGKWRFDGSATSLDTVSASVIPSAGSRPVGAPPLRSVMAGNSAGIGGG